MKKILVADDSVTIQKVIALTFADEPFEVQSVGTGAEALEMMKGLKPDILLADVIMPQMNGYELCRAVKEQQETSAVPVLLLAGTFEAFDEEEAKSVGADGYITKPFESGELIEKVNSLVGRKPTPEALPEPLAEAEQEKIPETGAPVEESLQAEPPQAEAPQVETFQMDSPDVGTVEMESPQVEPPQAGPPDMDSLGAESPEMEPFQMGGNEPPSGGAPEPDQKTSTVPGPVQGAGDVKSGEPDIWDILSDTDGGETLPETGISDAAVPGMGPIEDQGVVDVGSFDVGLDRPEEAPAQPEPTVEAGAEIPPMPEMPDSRQTAPEEPVESPVADEPAPAPEFQPEQVSPEKSRVEDREKDFFGFETEGPEAAGEEVFLGDAVEEITFDMEEPAAVSGDKDQEASFIVPEPAENEILVTGETISPDVMAPEPTLREEPSPEEPPLSLEQPFLEEQSPEEFAISMQEEITEPEAGEEAPPVQPSPPDLAPPQAPPADLSIPDEEPAGMQGDRPVIEPLPQKQATESEPGAGSLPADETMDIQPAEKVPTPVSRELSDAEVRKIVEERVEKIVWEVVPEMAEVIIKEAIEKIKGRP